MKFALQAIEILMAAGFVFLAIPVMVLTIEIVAAAFLHNRRKSILRAEGPRPRIAVLVPAHNESAGILPTISDIKKQLAAGDRLLVVADNCTDDTACIARRAQVEVVKRCEPERLGKGFALDFGVKHLVKDPPEVVIIIDADCRLEEGLLDDLARKTQATQKPCQAGNIMDLPECPTARHRIAAFAWVVKTFVRPLGLKLLRAPCNLQGTGMAFPWRLLLSLNLATGHVTEDAQFGLCLAAEGRGALFCPEVAVRSSFPQSAHAMEKQKRRWEHGSFLIILQTVPKVLLRSLSSLRWDGLVLSLDALVPPLVSLLMALAAYCLIALIHALFFTPYYLVAGLSLLAALVVVLTIAWLVFGRKTLHLGDAISLPLYAVRKLPHYIDFIRGKASKWDRTERD